MHLDDRDGSYEITSNTKLLCPKYTSRSPGMKREQGEPENLGVSDRSVLLLSPSLPLGAGPGIFAAVIVPRLVPVGGEGTRVCCVLEPQAFKPQKYQSWRVIAGRSSSHLRVFSFNSEMKEEGDLYPSSGS